jgi:hypothetical protein
MILCASVNMKIRPRHGLVRSLGGDRLTLASYYSMSDEKLCDKIGPTTCHVSRTTCLCRCCCCRECVCRSSAVPPIDCNQVAGLYLGMLVVRFGCMSLAGCTTKELAAYQHDNQRELAIVQPSDSGGEYDGSERRQQLQSLGGGER